MVVVYMEIWFWWTNKDLDDLGGASNLQHFTTTVEWWCHWSKIMCYVCFCKYSQSSKQLENLQLSSKGRCLNFYPSNSEKLEREIFLKRLILFWLPKSSSPVSHRDYSNWNLQIKIWTKPVLLNYSYQDQGISWHFELLERRGESIRMAHVLFRNLHLLGNLTIIKWSAIWYIPTGEKAQPSTTIELCTNGNPRAKIAWNCLKGDIERFKKTQECEDSLTLKLGLLHLPYITPLFF